jgi:hypothetical protein
VKLSASQGKLDKLRPDGIHIKRDGAGRITHSVIFEITRANDLPAKVWGDKVAQTIYMLCYLDVIRSKYHIGD